MTYSINFRLPVIVTIVLLFIVDYKFIKKRQFANRANYFDLDTNRKKRSNRMSHVGSELTATTEPQLGERGSSMEKKYTAGDRRCDDPMANRLNN